MKVRSVGKDDRKMRPTTAGLAQVFEGGKGRKVARNVVVEFGPDQRTSPPVGCTVLAAMRRYEFCQVFCRGIRAKLGCSLIPFSRLGDIRLNSDSAEPPDKKRIERLSQRESGSSATCLGGAP